MLETASRTEGWRQGDRTRHAAGRSQAERLLELGEHLPVAERLMLEQVYRHGLSRSELARLTGRRCRNVERQLNAIERRLRDPAFAFLVMHEAHVPARARATARRVVLEGASLRDAARATGQTLHRVRGHMRTLRRVMRWHAGRRAAERGR